MPTPSPTQAALYLLETIARWLPRAPHALDARIRDLAALIDRELPMLRWSIVVQRAESCTLYGPGSASTRQWLARSDAAVTQPANSTEVETGDGVRIVIAFWGRSPGSAIRQALLAQMALACTAPATSEAVPAADTRTPDALAAIQPIVQQINTTLNLDHVFETVLESAMAATGAAQAAIALQQGDVVRYVAWRGYNDEQARRLREVEIGDGESTADLALRHEQALMVVGDDEATLDAPIRYQDHAVGLISLRSAEGTLTDAHLPIVQLIADQTAIAIGNAQQAAEDVRQRELLQKRANVLNEVLEVGHLLRADRTLTDMLTDIAYGIVNAVGFRSVIVNLRRESDPTVFEPVAFAGILPDEVDRLRHEAIPATIVHALCNPDWRISGSYYARGEQVELIFGGDLDRLTTTTIADPRQGNEWQATDFFLTPLQGASGELVGFISVDDPFDRRRPTRRTAEAIEIFANQAVTAVENVHLYHASQRRLAEQNALNRIQRTVSASLDVRLILRAVYDGIQSVLPIDSYYSLIYDQYNHDSAIMVGCDEGAWFEDRINGLFDYRGLHAYLMDRREPLLFSDLRDEYGSIPPEYQVVTFGDEDKPSASWMGVPLVGHEGELIGAISAHSYAPGRFGPNELTFLQSVTHQVAISFQNARLFADRERRLQEANVVNQLARALAAPISLLGLADVLWTQIRTALNANSITLAVYDRENDVVDYPLVVNRNERSSTESRRGTSGITGYILQTRQSVLLNDDIAEQMTARGIEVIGEMCCSFAGAPLLVGDNAVGVLAVQDFDRNYALTEHELALLEAIALQIASGVEKARLLNERERQIAQMQTLNNIGKVTSSTLELYDLFSDLYHEISNYRKTDTLLLSVCDRESWQILQMMTIDKGDTYTIECARDIAPRSYTDVILRSGEPILFRNAPEEEALHGIDMLAIGAGNRAVSWAGVPLLNTSGEPFGILSMQSYSVGEYDLRDIDFLTNVAHQIALHIQNAALFKQSQEQVQQLAAETERLQLINRLSAWAGTTLDVQELVQRAVYELGRATDADQVRVLLLDRTRGLAICHAELRDTGAVGTLALPIKGNPAIEWFDTHHTSIFVPDAINDQRFVAAHEYWRADNIRDVLIVPLIVKGEVIGSIGLDAQEREHTFDERDIATCETIANQVATAIENARLWKTTQQSVHELTMLYDLSVSLTTMLDLDEILATLASAALEVQRADYGAVVLFDAHGHVTRSAALGRLVDDVDVAPWVDSAAVSHVLTTTKPLVIHDHAVSEWAAIGDGIASCVLVPVLAKSFPAGVLIVASEQARTWTEREQSLLTILAGQAASAIENARLFQAEQERRQLADTLREVAVALSATLDLQEVLQIILLQLRRVVPYDSAVVQMLHGDMLEVIVTDASADMGASERVGSRYPATVTHSPNHHVYYTHQPYIVLDARTEVPFFQTMPHTQHICSWMGVPLLYGNELLGIIGLDSCQAGAYSGEMADLALMFATQAAQAITRARLFNQIKQFNVELEQKVADRTAALVAEKERLEAVHTITTTLAASLDIDEIVLKTLELAAAAIGVSRGSVLIRDPMQDMLIYRAVLTETAGLITVSEPFDLPPGNLVQWTLEHQQGVVVNDVRRDPRWVSTGGHTSEIRSFIAVPLLASDVPLGVLMLNSREISFFNDEHLRLLTTIASEVAISVHNAELYNFINEQATRLAELLQVQREETGKNRAILESVAEGVLVLDERDSVVVYNRAASQVLRIAEDAVLGNGLEAIAHYGDDGTEHQRALLLYDALAEGVRAIRQQRDPRHTLLELPDQTIDLIYTPVTTPDGERVGVAVVLRDITREIEADKAKRAFIATVSHELRTPLTSVKGYVDLLLLGTGGAITDMQRSFLSVVKSNADRLNGLVEDLLEISRLENGKVALHIKPVQIPEIVNDILASLHTETQRKHMELQLEIEPTLPMVEADPKRIAQVLTNLLSNAHKYTRDGGQISVRAWSRDDVVQVDVVDTGVGIPPHQLPKMFSRFFRADNSLKEEVGGTGLGLSIAKSFVELHGGDMWVTSELEVGSTFSFTLPITQRRAVRDVIDADVVPAA